MAGLKLHQWVFSLWCRWFPERVRVRRRPIVRLVRPQLEGLEARLLLDANATGQAASALLGDLARLHNDLAAAKVALVNTVQPSTANAPTLMSPPNQLDKIVNVMAADWSQTLQSLVQFEDAVWGTYRDELATLLDHFYGSPLSQAPSTPGNSQQSSSSTAFQTTYSMTPPDQTPLAYQPKSLFSIHGLLGGSDPMYVLDRNTGETVPANVTLNTFSTWGENLWAQVSGATVSSYSWNVSSAPDLTSISGTTTANLQGSWSSFTGAARTDTIRVTETPTVGAPITLTMTFAVGGTDSPAYSSSRPTSSSTWPTVITPDQVPATQATEVAGPYASIGLADGSVQTIFTMPDYNTAPGSPSVSHTPL